MTLIIFGQIMIRSSKIYRMTMFIADAMSFRLSYSKTHGLNLLALHLQLMDFYVLNILINIFYHYILNLRS